MQNADGQITCSSPALCTKNARNSSQHLNQSSVRTQLNMMQMLPITHTVYVTTPAPMESPTCTTNTRTHTMYFCNGGVQKAGRDRKGSMHALCTPCHHQTELASVLRCIWVGSSHTRHEEFEGWRIQVTFHCQNFIYFFLWPNIGSKVIIQNSQKSQRSAGIIPQLQIQGKLIQCHISSQITHNLHWESNSVLQHYRSLLLFVYEIPHDSSHTGCKSSPTSRISLGPGGGKVPTSVCSACISVYEQLQLEPNFK